MYRYWSSSSSSSLSSSSSSFNIPSFQVLGLDLIWVTSSVFYPLPYLLFCSTSSCLLLLPYFRSSLAYTTGLLPSTFSSILLLLYKYAILIPTCTFYMTKPSQPHFSYLIYNLCSRFSTPHLLLTSSLVILFCHLTIDMLYLNILWSQLASSPFNLSVSAQVSAAYSNTGCTQAHSKPLLFPLVECYKWFTSKLSNFLHLLQTLDILSLTANSTPPPHEITLPR